MRGVNPQLESQVLAALILIYSISHRGEGPR